MEQMTLVHMQTKAKFDEPGKTFTIDGHPHPVLERRVRRGRINGRMTLQQPSQIGQMLPNDGGVGVREMLTAEPQIPDTRFNPFGDRVTLFRQRQVVQPEFRDDQAVHQSEFTPDHVRFAEFAYALHSDSAPPITFIL